MWMVSNGDFGAISQLSTVLGVVHFGLAMLDAVGTVLLVWALVRLLRQRAATP
jgi:hypothetical protein